MEKTGALLCSAKFRKYLLPYYGCYTSVWEFFKLRGVASTVEKHDQQTGLAAVPRVAWTYANPKSDSKIVSRVLRCYAAGWLLCFSLCHVFQVDFLFECSVLTTPKVCVLQLD